MADNTIIQQGNFTSDGTATTIELRNGVDWMEVWNLTQAGDTNDAGVKFYWQRGMANDQGIEIRKTGGVDTLEMLALADGGFTYVDTTDQRPGAAVALTAVDNANPPEVTTASTAALRDGDIVRIINVTGAQQLGGYDFTIDVTSGTTFQLEYMAQIVAGTNGFYRVLPFQPIFYPRHRYITKATQAASMVVTMSVTHGFTIGQEVRLIVPAAFGMVEADKLQATVLDVDLVNNTITLDVDSSAFTAFAFPLTAAVPFTPALVVPIGDFPSSTGTFEDATLNTALIGMRLAGGIDSPAGQDGDEIYWKAGTSFNVNNLIV